MRVRVRAAVAGGVWISLNSYSTRSPQSASAISKGIKLQLQILIKLHKEMFKMFYSIAERMLMRIFKAKFIHDPHPHWIKFLYILKSKNYINFLRMKHWSNV